MYERLHKVLDGEMPEEELSPEERQTLARMTASFDSAIEGLHEPAAPDLTQRVLEALPEPGRASIRPRWVVELADWVWRPRAVQFRPAYGLVAAAVLAAMTSIARTPSAVDPSLALEHTQPPALFVQFRLDAPGAQSVQVTGSFTNWADGLDLVETMPGVWSTMLRLEPGVHDYSFIVDDEVWIVDPSAPSVEDPFGGVKSRLFLTSPLENA